MDISGVVLLQLAVATLFAILLFYGAYSLPRKVGAILLLVLLPFQAVETSYFTANVLLTYVVFIALLLRGETLKLPLLAPVLILLFCYFLTFSQVHPENYIRHAVYIFALISAFLIMWISYDLTMRFKNPSSIVNVFLVTNIAVVIYCGIQMSFGPGTKVTLFGMDEFSMMPMRTNNRLSGPFGAVGLTAEYFVLMTVLILHQVMHTRRSSYRVALIALGGANTVLLLATGNRTGLVLLVFGMIAYIWLFRKELGLGRTLGLFAGGTTVFVLASILVVSFTPYGQVFERLADTTFEEGVPDTRQAVWPFVWKEIKRKPLLGHGPRLRFPGGDEGTRYTGHTYVRYPHNLGLFLLFTVGAVGLLAFISFLMIPLYRCWRASLVQHSDPYLQYFAKTGVLILLIFLADQIKIGFMRLAAVDYWHFMFAIFGMLIAICDRVEQSERQPVSGKRY